MHEFEFLMDPSYELIKYLTIKSFILFMNNEENRLLLISSGQSQFPFVHDKRTEIALHPRTENRIDSGEWVARRAR